MKKLLLSAGFATLLASTALAQTSQTFNECRQIDGALHWFLVTYTMFEEPAPTGHRVPTEVQDTGAPCAAADYEQSRQYALMWGENWPLLEPQTAFAQAQPAARVVGPVRVAVVQRQVVARPV